ncbi:uncharacterized protein LOC106643070 [Copidosoma floridanum]|uniref:uncharacterized protein LOC106643070 n=1 Tax=Copidosoma floridanum TaxID=29053 RepID=UPI0006C96A64|nr:uncharacterized protein LOC106643070 [Copidosoma floridanum]
MKYLVVLMTCLLACAYAAPNPEEPAPHAADGQMVPSQQQITDLFTNAQSVLADLWSNIKNNYVANNDYVSNLVKNQTAAFFGNVQEFMTQTSNKLKEKAPEVEKQLMEIQNKLKVMVEGVNANVPNAKESAEQLQKQFQEGIQTFIKEAGTLSDKVKENSGQVREEIANFTKQAITSAVEATKGLQEQLKNLASSTTEKSS